MSPIGQQTSSASAANSKVAFHQSEFDKMKKNLAGSDSGSDATAMQQEPDIEPIHFVCASSQDCDKNANNCRPDVKDYWRTNQEKAEVLIDMMYPHRVKSLVIHWWGSSHANRWRIESSDDEKAWVSEFSHPDSKQYHNVDRVSHLPFTFSNAARFLRISMTHGNLDPWWNRYRFGIRKIEIEGYEIFRENSVESSMELPDFDPEMIVRAKRKAARFWHPSGLPSTAMFLDVLNKKERVWPKRQMGADAVRAERAMAPPPLCLIMNDLRRQWAMQGAQMERDFQPIFGERLHSLHGESRDEDTATQNPPTIPPPSRESDQSSSQRPMTTSSVPARSHTRASDRATTAATPQTNQGRRVRKKSGDGGEGLGDVAPPPPQQGHWGLANDLRDGWREVLDEKGDAYFVNDHTGASQRLKPEAEKLPDGWVGMRTEDDQNYYYHRKNGTVQWDRPGEKPTEDGDAALGMKDWIECEDASGAKYYHNTKTEETSYDPPARFMEIAADAIDPGPLPPGWQEVADDEGQVYYWNEITDESQWDRPTYPRPDATERNWDENPLDADFAEKYEFEHDLPE